MDYIADLHIHSHYSRATSKNLNLESLYQWAQIKGINVIGTGDFTHPGWIEELQSKLEPDGNGFFLLKNPPKESGLSGIRTKNIDVRFCLSAEISSIYKFGDKVRKNHNLVYAPDFETAKKINARLGEIGNLSSDGRPILGLPARDLLEIVLETSDNAHLIPAHVWTPWFSTLGSKAGYDSIDECFRDLTEHIFALETGLSSDPEMNWKISALDKYTLVSNSDAHSAQKLGREANLFDTELSYYAMFEALKTKKGFNGTYEFFPEEGKYHMDGHRKCNVCMEPRESMKLHEICPVCGKPLTIGVLNRVETLADRELPMQPKEAPDFKYIIPLPEIIAEFTGTDSGSKSVQQTFTRIISTFGNEFDLLHKIPLEEIKSKGGELLMEAISRLRNREVNPQGGYDGEYGVISVFKPGEIEKLSGQTDLFGGIPIPKTKQRKTPKHELHQKISEVKKYDYSANEEQQKAIESPENTIVTAGPGTGKTNTLIRWIAQQIEHAGIAPEEIIAITFTNKAADELQERLDKQMGKLAGQIVCGTFHAIAYNFLREIKPDISTIYDANNRKQVFGILFPELSKKDINKLSNIYEEFHEGMKTENIQDFLFRFDVYHSFLENHHAVDLSSMIWQANILLSSTTNEITTKYKCITVDEFQDINPVQYKFIKLISKDKRFFAIGDPNQSIYGFRGSDINLFFKAKDDFNSAEIFLKKNYRTPVKIMEAANMLIAKNELKAQYQPEATKTDEVLIQNFDAGDEKQEAKYIAEKILYYIGGTDATTTGQTLSDYNYAFSDITVLYRTHLVGNEIARTLKQYGIPVVLSDGTSFLSTPPLDKLTYALQLLENKDNVIALSGLLALIGDIPEKQMPVLINQYMENKIGAEHLSSSSQWQKWISLYHELSPVFDNLKTGDILQQLADLLIPVSDMEEQDVYKREILLKSAINWTDTPKDFLRKQILSPYTDAARDKSTGVRLMTFHASKGLEFPVVFIAGAEEGISPTNRPDTDMEEERRLFYVAMTRTKEILHISHAEKRTIFGKEQKMQVSRFMEEIDKSLLTDSKPELSKKAKIQDQQLRLF
ncbi:MAG: UvrD-helicase domain-containing protein [Paludibacter sp.]|nr:UvrD-helicase domain-containing protein [Paludibacter sp.]